MTEIFARCERVIVWLGEGGLMAPGLTDFYMLHSTILPPLREYIKAHGTESLSWGDWDEDTFYKRLALENICERLDWKGYRRFYRERNWFERAWVFQEVAFVPEVVVLCGNYTFSLDDLGMLADCLRLSGLATTTMIARFDGSSIFRLPGMEVNAFHRLRKTCSGIGSETWLAYWAGLINIINLECTSYMFFLYCIRQLRHSQATDPRDKIFAAYGFLKKCLPAGITPRIQPDYTLPVEDVYTMTAATLLQVLPELSLLSEVEDLSLRRLERLPSWVPDFSAPEAQSLLGSDRRDRYNASLPQHRNRSSKLGPPVTKITSDLTATGALEHTSEHIVSWFNVISDLTARGEPGLETVWEVLWRTLIANKVNEPGCAVVTRETFHDFILQWFITCATILRDEELNPTLEAWAADNACLPTEDTLQGYAARARAVRDSLYLSSEDLDSLAKVERNRATFAEAISRSALHRRLFVTEYGRLGLGPQSMQPSDQVWLICGARMLFVLRPTSDEGCFTLVGETYVHGCMNGEVVDMFEDRMGAVTLI
ncbi:hypothetical protein H2199_008419 [Coniosporium tulheliwenetii]|uniref:Uncharacterized protein n=1 Tax=Coniosporium tulheliwenetii TaxID=3383036 RepID=A0ACC2YJI0_9PEZI|nr:hypothetical protein H2199_008419 [Cladosporium sp. JES 115]